MSKQKKILIIANNIDGGISSFLYQMVKLPDILNEKYSLKIVSLKGPKYSHIDISLIGKAVYIKKIRKNGIVGDIMWLRNVISKEKPQIIITIDTKISLIIGLLKKFGLIRGLIIVTNHNNVEAILHERYHYWQRKIIQFLGFIAFNKASAVVCLSTGLADSYRRLFKIQQIIHVIPYYIDRKTVALRSQEDILRGDEVYFGKGYRIVMTIGRLETQKNFELLVRAFTYIRYSKVRLIIIGEGSLRTKLASLIGKLKLKNRVILIGWRNNVFPYLKKADIFVLPSRYEGFGQVLLEAMALGIPTVSADAPFGPGEILKLGKYGLVLSKNQPNEMGRTIDLLLSDKKEWKRLSLAGLSRVKDFSSTNVLPRYKELIEKM